MRDMTELRAELDAIDRDMVALFEKRMLVAREVAMYKLAHGMQVLDAAREETVLASRVSMLRDGAFAADVRTLYTCIMACSRGEQEKCIREAENV